MNAKRTLTKTSNAAIKTLKIPLKIEIENKKTTRKLLILLVRKKV